MTTLAATANTAAGARPGRSLWGDAFVRLRRDKPAVVCFVIILIYAAVAVAAPFLFANWDAKTDYNNTYAQPSTRSFKLLMGTDVFGRSIMEETLLGAHVSMTVAFMANAIAVPLGMLLGAVAGYHGRKTDDVIVWLYTTLASIPGFILLIALKFAFADRVLFADTPLAVSMDGMAGLILALGVMSWIGTCRLVRAETMKIRELDYVLAARAAGSSSLSILFKHVLPNVAHIGIIQFSLGFVGAISAEVGLSYLGLGVKDMPSWGKMINSARLDLGVGRWAEITAAVSATFLIVLAWNVFGDRLRDALDPRLRNV